MRLNRRKQPSSILFSQRSHLFLEAFHLDHVCGRSAMLLGNMPLYSSFQMIVSVLTCQRNELRASDKTYLGKGLVKDKSVTEQ